VGGAVVVGVVRGGTPAARRRRGRRGQAVFTVLPRVPPLRERLAEGGSVLGLGGEGLGVLGEAPGCAVVAEAVRRHVPVGLAGPEGRAERLAPGLSVV